MAAGSVIEVDDAARQRHHHGFGTVLDAELFVNVAKVGFDGALSAIEDPADFRVAEALGGEAEDLDLPLGEVDARRVVG